MWCLLNQGIFKLIQLLRHFGSTMYHAAKNKFAR
jgi:hypothetical protein